MLSEAIELADSLAEAIASEVECARVDPRALRNLDPQQLWAQASRRRAFHDRIAFLEKRLAESLAQAAGQVGLTTVTIATLAEKLPESGGQLREAFDRVKRVSLELASVEKLNGRLAQRAKSCVDAYVSALAIRPSAYTRRGALATQARSGTMSQRA